MKRNYDSINQFNVSTLMKYVLKFKLEFILATVFNILFSLIVVGYAEMFRVFFDDAQAGHLSNIKSNIFLIILMIVCQTIFHYIASRNTHKLYLKLREYLQKESIYYVMDGDIREVRNYHTGELISISLNDVDQVANLGSTVLIRALHIIFKTVIFIVYLLKINLILGLVSLIFGPILLLLGKMFSLKIERASSKSSEANAMVTATTSELFDKFELFKINDTSTYLKSRLDCLFKTKYKIDNIYDKYYKSYDELSSAIGQVANVSVLSIGAYLIAVGELTTGTLVAFMQIVNQIIWPLVTLNSYIASYSSVKAKFERLNIVRNFTKHSSSFNVHTDQSALRFSNVSFSYQSEQVFDDINFEIEKGEFVLLVGGNGVGKTTLIKLIAGLYKPSNGIISFNQNDYEKQKQSNINYIMQSNNLFMGSIKENIIFDNKTSAQDDIYSLFESMDLDNDFSDGLNTKLSQNSVNISGGQKQKVALLRGFLKNSQLVLLDESLSAIDIESKLRIKKLLFEYIDSKTTIVINHDFDMVEKVDSILYINGKGEVFKEKHNDLLMSNQEYKDFFSKRLSKSVKSHWLFDN